MHSSHAIGYVIHSSPTIIGCVIHSKACFEQALGWPVIGEGGIYKGGICKNICRDILFFNYILSPSVRNGTVV